MHIHLIGIGGIAMGNLAAMLKHQGHSVSGSDQELYPPMSTKLKQWGIQAKTFSPTNLEGVNLCVIGNAISRGNIELEAILNQNLAYMSMPQALEQFFLQGKNTIVTAGTHGKTSCSFLLDHILQYAGRKNSLFAGGVRQDLMDGFRLGEGSDFVIEGDEYDSAFFDKGPKFLHYHPHYLILTAVEYDHADIYPNLTSYKLSFKRLLNLIPSSGLVIANRDDANIQDILQGYNLAPVHNYYLGSNASPKNDNWVSSSYQAFGKSWDLSFINKSKNFALAGAHNRANALASSLVALHLGISPQQIKQGLASFPGVLRRQQIRLDLSYKQTASGPLSFIEDFAHHPGALHAIIAAIREKYPQRKLHLLFEPRSASNHRNIFWNLYQHHFSQADYVYISEVFNPKKVQASEKLDVFALVQAIQSSQTTAFYGKNPQDLLKLFTKHFQASAEGDVILGLSNGNFGNIYPEIEKFLESRGDRQNEKLK